YTKNAELIPTDRRPKVAWPGRREMRRWARRADGKGREYEHLRDAHSNILRLLDEIRQPRLSPAVLRPSLPKPVVRPTANSVTGSKAPFQFSVLRPRADDDLVVLKEGTTEIH